MPLHRYTCNCAAITERLYLGSEEVEDEVSCARPDCGMLAKRNQVNSFSVVGLIHDGLEELNDTLFSPEERKGGREVRSKKQREQREAELGLRVMDEHEVRLARQEQSADIVQMTEIAKESGRNAVFDYVDKTEVLKATGWDTTKYNRWKEATDAAETSAPDTV